METKKTTLTRTGIALAVGLSGCGVQHAVTPTTEPAVELATVELATVEQDKLPPDRAALEQSVQDSLDRLRALDLFNVGTLVMKLPANSMQCYGLCPGFEGVYHTELTRQAARLSVFVERAQLCNSGNCYVSLPESGAVELSALSALNALEIVHVTSLVTAAPKNNPSCYNLPCAEDLEAAKTENRRREFVALVIANYGQAR